MRVENHEAMNLVQTIQKIEPSQETQIRFSLEGFHPPAGETGLKTAAPGDGQKPMRYAQSDQFAIARHGFEFSWALQGAATEPGKLFVEIDQEDQVRINLIRKYLSRLTGREISLSVPSHFNIIQDHKTSRLDLADANNSLLSVIRKKDDGGGEILTIGSDLDSMIYIGHLKDQLNLDADAYGMQVADLNDHQVDLTI